MSEKGADSERVRITLSKWSKSSLDALAARKAYHPGTLYRLALDLGTADLIAHFHALEQNTPPGLDSSGLGGILPGVDVERNRRAANRSKRANKAKAGGIG